MAGRKRYSREFKLAAVKLVTERGVTVAQAARDLRRAVPVGIRASLDFCDAAVGPSRSPNVPAHVEYWWEVVAERCARLQCLSDQRGNRL